MSDTEMMLADALNEIDELRRDLDFKDRVFAVHDEKFDRFIKGAKENAKIINDVRNERDALQSQLARVTAERDALSKELDAVHEADQKEIHALRNELDQALEHLSALKRTQKLDAANFARLVKNNEALRGFANAAIDRAREPGSNDIDLFVIEAIACDYRLMAPDDWASVGCSPTPLLTGEAEE